MIEPSSTAFLVVKQGAGSEVRELGYEPSTYEMPEWQAED